MNKMDEFFDYLKKMEDKIGKNEINKNPLLEMLSNFDAPIIIYGAGAVGHAVYDVLRKNNIVPQFFCSGLASGYIDQITGLSVIHKDELKDHHKGIIILSIGDTASKEEKKQIKSDLITMGYSERKILHHSALEEKISPTFLLEHAQEIRKVYTLLSDDESRRVYLQKLEYMIKNMDVKFECFHKMYVDKDFINWSNSEIIIDAGAYDGDSALLFRNDAGALADIYAFEPDLLNHNNLKKRVNHDSRIHTEQFGLWKYKGILHFSNIGNGSSRIEKAGKLQISVIDLDSYCSEKGMIPTYIKMDIEGAETEAIIGAERTIRNYKPKLAICLYHKAEDIFMIPLLIHKINSSYRMYIRHYSDCKTDTLLYAV